MFLEAGTYGVPLPPCPSSFSESDSSSHLHLLDSAYSRIVDLESEHMRGLGGDDSELETSLPSNTVLLARILGYMLLESSFDPSGQMNLAREVMSCADDDALLDLGRIYKDTFLLPCKYVRTIVIDE